MSCPRTTGHGALLAAVFVLVSGPSVHAGGPSSLNVSWTLSPDSLRFAEIDTFEVVSLGGVSESTLILEGEAGKPALPVLGSDVLLPPDKYVSDVSVVTTTWSDPNSHMLYPAQLPGTIDGGPQPEFVPPDSSTYSSFTSYPAVIVQETDERDFRGYRIAHLRVFPVQYTGESRTVTLNTSITATLALADLSQADLDRVPRRERPEADPGFKQMILEWLAGSVENPVDIPRFYAEPWGLTIEHPHGGFLPTEKPSIDGPPVGYVIITSNELAAEFQPLADWKTRTGMPAVVRTVSWIEANYPGADVQTRVRAFIRDAYIKWSTNYVLLGGDTPIVPHRVFRLGDIHFLDPPVDYYYSDLTVSWNSDGDDRFGETGDGSDAGPDVIVGRAPVNTTEEVAAFIDKVKTYARVPGTQAIDETYYRRLALMAGLTNECGWTGPWDNGMRHGEAIAAVVAPDVPIQRIYTNIFFPECEAQLGSARAALNPYQTEIELNRFSSEGMRTALNDDVGYVFHLEHSFTDRLGGPTDPCTAPWNACPELTGHFPSGELGFSRGMTQLLNSAGEFSIVYSRGSYQNSIDMDCVGEELVRTPDGGAVAYLGKQRSIVSNAEVTTPIEFFERVFNANLHPVLHELGPTFYGAMTDPVHAPDQLTPLIRHDLLGDPQMPLFRSQPAALTVTAPSSVAVGASEIEVQVTGLGGSGVGGARVCLSQDSQDSVPGIVGDLLYAFAYTASSGADLGKARFRIEAEKERPIAVTVTAPGYKPDQRTIAVTAASAAHIYYKSHEVLGTLGDGQGRGKVGYKGTVRVTVENRGGQAADVRGIIKPRGSLMFDLRIKSDALSPATRRPSRVFIGNARVNPPTVPFSFEHLAFAGIDPQASPPPSFPAGGGYLLWQEGSIWRLACQGANASEVFEGEVFAPGGISNDSVVEPLEEGEFWQVAYAAPPDSIIIRNVSAPPSPPPGDVDGFQWMAADGVFVTIPYQSPTFGVVNPGGSASADFTNVEFLPADSDAHELRLNLEMVDNQSGHPAGNSDFSLALTGPRLAEVKQRVFQNTRITSPYLFTFDMYVTVRNRGTATAENVSVRIENQQGATIVIGQASVGALAPGQEAESGLLRFRAFNLNSVLLKVTVANTFTGGQGGTVSWQQSNVDAVRPAAPATNLTGLPGAGGNFLWWTPSTDGTTKGYHVYRRIAGAGSFVRVNDARIDTATVFFDSDGALVPEYPYEYYVTAVDGSWNESVQSNPATVTMALAELPGWPQRVDTGTEGSVLVQDLDLNGDKEIVFAGNSVYAWHHTGAGLTNPDGLFASFGDQSGTLQGRRFFGKFAALASEFIAGASFYEDSQGKALYFWQLDGTPMASFSLDGGAGLSSPVVANLPGGPGPEVVITSRMGTLFIWSYEPINDDGVFYAYTPVQLGTRSQSLTDVAVGNVDGDGYPDIVYATGQSQVVVIEARGFNNLVQQIPTYSQGNCPGANCPGVMSTPLLANLDGDANDEIVLGWGDRKWAVPDRVIMLDYNTSTGQLQLGWQVLLTDEETLGNSDGYTPRPAAGDIDNDGQLEIVIGDSRGHGTSFPIDDKLALHVIQADGTGHQVWEFTPRERVFGDRVGFVDRRVNGILSPCTVVDVDGDDYDEVFHGSDLRHVMAWDPVTVKPEPGWPVMLRDRVLGEVTLANVDNVGGLEVVASDFGGWVHIWDYADLQGKGEGGGRWVKREGLHETVPNPFNPATAIAYDLERSGRVELKVYSTVGRLVRALVDGRQEGGGYSVQWDGRDANGQPAASGVYFFRLTQDGRWVGTVKAVLLR